MKYYKLFIAQVVFFILMTTTMVFLKDFLLVKRISYGLLIAGLTYIIYSNFYKNYRDKNRLFVLNLFSLFFLFELQKYLGYVFGISSPKYTETVLISMAFSLLLIAIYLGILLLIAYLVRRVKKIK